MKKRRKPLGSEIRSFLVVVVPPSYFDRQQQDESVRVKHCILRKEENFFIFPPFLLRFPVPPTTGAALHNIAFQFRRQKEHLKKFVAFKNKNILPR
jgi:hypothetical protein